MLIRPARPDEAAVLSGIAVRSKAHWPYPAEFLARFARTLALTPSVVAANDVWVADRDGVPIGFYVLLDRGDLSVLDDLWLEPAEIGRGYGRQLFEHALARATATGAAFLEWEAEPYAMGFYERMGARRVRWVQSALGRHLPVMRVALTAEPGSVSSTT